MGTIKTFFSFNLRQFKTVFLAVVVIFTLFTACLLIFGSNKYSLFDTITLPIGLGIFVGLIMVSIMVLTGYSNWVYRERYFKKHLHIFIEAHQFNIRPYPRSIWALTMPALCGTLSDQEIIIELIEQKNLFISFINEKTPITNKHGFIYSYQNFKKLGVDNLLDELTLITRAAE